MSSLPTYWFNMRETWERQPSDLTVMNMDRLDPSDQGRESAVVINKYCDSKVEFQFSWKIDFAQPITEVF